MLARDPPAADRLTEREHEVLGLIARGCTDREIGRRLTLSETIIKKHVQNILGKLHARNRAAAVARSQRLRHEPAPRRPAVRCGICGGRRPRAAIVSGDGLLPLCTRDLLQAVDRGRTVVVMPVRLPGYSHAERTAAQ